MRTPGTIELPCNCPETVGTFIGQTVNNARVVDEHGNGIQAVFFFIDENSDKLSQEWATNSDGTFHWSIEGRDPAGIWINVSNEYEAKVFTPDELLQSPTVTLKSTPGSSVAPWVPLVIVGVAAITLTGKRKSVTGLKLKERYSKLSPTTKKVLLYGGGGLAAYFLLRYVFSYKPTQQQLDTLESAKNQLAYLAARYGVVPSQPVAQFSAWSGVIVEAVNKCGTDEGAIYRVFEQLSNEADVYKLIAVFGIGKYIGCLDRGLFDPYVHKTLPEALTDDMSTSNVSYINEILSDKGIDFRF